MNQRQPIYRKSLGLRDIDSRCLLLLRWRLSDLIGLVLAFCILYRLFSFRSLCVCLSPCPRISVFLPVPVSLSLSICSCTCLFSCLSVPVSLVQSLCSGLSVIASRPKPNIMHAYKAYWLSRFALLSIIDHAVPVPLLPLSLSLSFSLLLSLCLSLYEARLLCLAVGTNYQATPLTRGSMGLDLATEIQAMEISKSEV